MKTYFLHISSNNLADIISNAAVRPTALIDEREKDLQDNFPEHILLSEKKWHKNYDCSVEVILNEEEETSLQFISMHYKILHSFLPISRIKSIFFPEKEKANTVFWNIEKSGTGYIPERWRKVSEKTKDDVTNEIPSAPQEIKQLEGGSFSKSVGAFNRLLGGLAFMRTSIYNMEDKLLNYPVNYISTISFFNSKIGNELEKEKGDFNKTFHSIFKGDAKIFHFLHKQITKDVLKNVALQEGVELNEKFNYIILDDTPKNSLFYQLGILYNYGEGKPKKVQDLLGSLFSDLHWEKKEEIALIFGLHTGYRLLRNEYKIGNRNWEVKFRMENKIDFYLLESVFEYVKDKTNKPHDFQFLEPAFPTPKKKRIPVEYNAYEILDTTVITKKNDYQEILHDMVKKVTKEVAQWFPSALFQPQEEEIQKKIEVSVQDQFSEFVDQLRSDLNKNIQRNQILKKEEENSLTDIEEDSPAPTFTWKNDEPKNDLDHANTVTVDDLESKNENDNAALEREKLSVPLDINENDKEKVEKEQGMQNKGIGKVKLAQTETGEKGEDRDDLKSGVEDNQKLEYNREDPARDLFSQESSENLNKENEKKEADNSIVTQDSEGNNAVTVAELRLLNLKDLQKFAKKNNMRGYSKFKKDELLKEILSRLE